MPVSGQIPARFHFLEQHKFESLAAYARASHADAPILIIVSCEDEIASCARFVIVVDQFEELWTLTADAGLRAQFIDLLAAAVADPRGRVRVLVTLRADFYDRPLAVPGFGAIVNAATVTVPAMATGDLEAAVVCPAERVGRRVEPALVAELVRAVADEPVGSAR